MYKKWDLVAIDEARVNLLHAELKISKTLCKILVQRGYTAYESAKKYFRPQLSDLHSPWLMKDMDKAVTRILSAFKANEKILIFGDYDVDGTASVACLFQFLKSLYQQIDFYVPNRLREGYGISQCGIEFAQRENFSLIISVDCGIKSADLIAAAKSSRIDFIVCDHHLPEDILPPAIAILNPKQNDCNYPYKNLCGCGVVFKLMMALSEKLNLPADAYLQYIDILATAIAADIVEITGENRVMMYFGLQKLNTKPVVGIRALLKLAEIKKQLVTNDLVFVIAPRINASGRMDDAKKSIQLLIETNFEKALEYAKGLHLQNVHRREVDTNITTEALAILAADENMQNKKTTVLYQPHWNSGVIGIVASRLIDTYYRPTIILTKVGDILKGSARSVVGFNLYEAIHSCCEYLLGYGGHFAAAGLSLLPKHLPAFREAFEKIVHKTLPHELLYPKIVIDSEILFSEVTPAFYNIITQMEPFGPANMRPIWLATNVVDTGYSRVVKEQHIRFVVKQNGVTLTGIGFGMVDDFKNLSTGSPFDIVFSIDENEWREQKMLQLKVLAIRKSEE